MPKQPDNATWPASTRLMARHFPEWRSIRADPRFQAILREMDAPVP